MLIKWKFFTEIIRSIRNAIYFLMYYYRVVQTKVTDVFNTQLNSISLNPYFFRDFLKKWRKKNKLDKKA